MEKFFEKNFGKNFEKNCGKETILEKILEKILKKNFGKHFGKNLRKNFGKNLGKRILEKVFEKIVEKFFEKNFGKGFRLRLPDAMGAANCACGGPILPKIVVSIFRTPCSIFRIFVLFLVTKFLVLELLPTVHVSRFLVHIMGPWHLETHASCVKKSEQRFFIFCRFH